MLILCCILKTQCSVPCRKKGSFRKKIERERGNIILLNKSWPSRKRRVETNHLTRARVADRRREINGTLNTILTRGNFTYDE